MQPERLGMTLFVVVLATFLYLEKTPTVSKWLGEGFQEHVFRWLWRLAGGLLALVLGGSLARFLKG